MDILSEAIAAIRTGTPASGLFVRHAPWGRHYPKVPGAGFHVVLQGSCWAVPPAGEPIALGVGDVLFMPRGADHELVDALGSPITEVARPGEPREITGPGTRTALVCGAYELGRQRSHPILDELPEFIHLPARPGRHPALRAAVDLLAGEIGAPGPGTDAAVPPLLETLLLFILRAWLADRAETPTGWAAAFADAAVAAALRAIHDAPEQTWTVPELSAVAGVSRATLARRFLATVGEPPLSYLTRWRMLTAARLLRETDTPLAGVARKVGYQSEFAFAKAFKREYGFAPGRYRRAEDAPAVIAV
ncbi:AraC family transcriptional regulator [Nocardia seriolae]|uniref:AraC family transcriptional regulator n=1 Tax=Nocardia seriolae TaxID=37332 RepID=A0ABC9YNY5_9NOCA|nr:AraC family transcriptional regulator [Nocardia seriolae]BEK99628.1 AraC family transcriptional regulator [Nocardia seriolae]GAM44777.1 AraC family transcriptional regulator [Nocardia seriolae]GAP26801.1 AraC family transcriptional regulator [Nocardia seriolae]